MSAEGTEIVRGEDSHDPHTEAAVHVANAQAALESQVVEPSEVVFSVVPERGTLVVVDGEKYAEHPRRHKGHFLVHDLESFMEFVDRHYDDSTTTVWVSEPDRRLRAVFDDHARYGAESGLRAAGWREFSATLALAHTPEWSRWVMHDGSFRSQEDFAEHIEDSLLEIVQPEGATMLEIAKTFQANRSANFRQATRLVDGNVQFRYEEQTVASAGTTGDVVIPETFTLGIAPFVGEQPFELTARLRYRLNSGKLTIGYKLDRPERVVRECVQQMRDALTTKWPGRVFAGGASG